MFSFLIRVHLGVERVVRDIWMLVLVVGFSNSYAGYILISYRIPSRGGMAVIMYSKKIRYS